MTAKKNSTPKDEPKNAVVPAESGGELATAAPSFMDGAAGRGVGNLGMEDVALPRFGLMQAISPQTEQGLTKPGEYYHLLAEKVLGTEVRIIPIFISSAMMLWRPRKSGGGLLARADDNKTWTPSNAEFQVTLEGGINVVWKTMGSVEESGLAEWGSSNPADKLSQPAATKMLNMLAHLPDFPELSPSIYTFQRASLKAGRQFSGKLKMSTAPCYGTVFKMGSILTKGTGGNFQMPTLTMAGYLTDEALYRHLEKMNQRFEKAGLRVAESGLDNEGGGDAGASGGQPRDDI